MMVLRYPKIFLRKIQEEAEVEYRLLLLTMGNRKYPTPDMVELISYKSDVDWFRSTEFRMGLISYRNYGYKMLVKKARPKKHYNKRNKTLME